MQLYVHVPAMAKAAAGMNDTLQTNAKTMAAVKREMLREKRRRIIRRNYFLVLVVVFKNRFTR